MNNKKAKIHTFIRHQVVCHDFILECKELSDAWKALEKARIYYDEPTAGEIVVVRYIDDGETIRQDAIINIFA